MGKQQHTSDAPKPFVFVLMPFAKSFNPVYASIKRAALDAGCYAERVDDQHYDEEMADRIRNQIAKADFLIAVTDRRNPNVAFEIGYAQALGKLQIYCTKDIETIPFDLKTRPHVVYTNPHDLQRQLAKKIEWAKEAIRNRDPVFDVSQLRLEFGSQTLYPVTPSHPVHFGNGTTAYISLYNDSAKTSPPISNVHFLIDSLLSINLLDDATGTLLPHGFRRTPSDVMNLYQLDPGFPLLPPDGCASLKIRVDVATRVHRGEPRFVKCSLLLFINGEWLDIPFTLQF